jgi:hypothetical protein
MATIASHPEKVRVRTHDWSVAHVAGVVSYWLIIAASYLTYGFLFYYAAKEKLFDDSGTMPAPLAKAFHGSLIASFPGVNASWVLLGLLEGLVVVGIVASLVTGEFLPSRGKPILLGSFGLAMFAFGLMAFAQNMIGGFATVAELFGYFSGTAVLIILLLLMPPYRSSSWISSLTNK